MPERAFLGVGSNLGDRLGTLQEAAELLGATDGVRLLRSSRIYETAPIGPPQPDFLNAVLELETELSPRELLRATQTVETKLGRVRQERWGPRTIDIDLLNVDGRTIDEPDLVVPHPRMHLRAFVMFPLLELTATPMLPGGLAVSDAAPEGDVKVFAPPLEVPG